MWMTARYLTDVQSLEAFDCADSSGIAARWERWLRAFELFVEGKGITNHNQKKALLLHSAGMSVQGIFFTLPEEIKGASSYVKAVNALNKHFKPQANVPYERLVFRETKQSMSETIEQYVTRLRQVREIACAMEDAETQAGEIEGRKKVNWVFGNRKNQDSMLNLVLVK